MLLAYRLRFEPSDAQFFLRAGWPVLSALILLQLAIGAVAGLYRQHGQVMWPVRLAAGAIGGVAAGLAAAFGLDVEAGVSRQAVASQAALFGVGGVLWRSVVGLRVRQRRREEIRERFGHDELVELGADLASMTGGVARAWDYRHLLLNIVAKDLKLKYQRSVLGFAWSLLNPMIMIGVYTVAFTVVMRLPTSRFVLFILIGLLAWNFFSGTVSGATEAVTGNASLLKSVVFPRVVLPFSAVLFNLAQYLLTLAVFLPAVLLVYGVPPAPRMLLFPVFLVLQAVFTAGLTLLIATAATVYRDVKHLVEVGLGIFFWATPIIYEPTMIPAPFQQLALLSPTASYVRAYQDLFYYGVVPDLAIWLVAIVYAAGMFVCGLSVFLACEDRFPEYL
jgi:ABC-2 type transport system permease protein